MSSRGIDKVAEKVAEATSLQIRDQKQTITRLNRRLAKEKNRTEAIFNAVYEAIHDGIAGLEFADFTPPKKDRRTKGEEWAICVLSDWQLGKETQTYNSEVCEERVARYAEKVSRLVELQRADHPVKKVALFLVGDMIEGELIFPGQAHEIDSSFGQQVTIDGPRILCSLVRWAASEFEEVAVYAVPGNHGYMGGRQRRDMKRDSNGDRMLYHVTRQIIEHEGLPNVTWNISDEWWLVADLGEKLRFLLLHGDQVRGYNGIPWYGWTRKILSWASLSRIWEDMDFDHVVAGHFHTPINMYVNGRRLWINASTESHNPYALEQLGAAGEPAQWLLFAKPGKQGVTAEYLVGLS
jgi:hypothetical protein